MPHGACSHTAFDRLPAAEPTESNTNAGIATMIPTPAPNTARETHRRRIGSTHPEIARASLMRLNAKRLNSDTD